MGFDLENERLLNMAEAAKLFPSSRSGKPCHKSRVIRAIVYGTPIGDGGCRIRLSGLRIGSQWSTSAKAIQRYCDLLTSAYTGRPIPEPETAGSR